MTMGEGLKKIESWLDNNIISPNDTKVKWLYDALLRERKRSARFIREAREYREAYRQLDRRWVHPRG